MFSKGVLVHGFNPQSSYRQPALHLRPIHQIVSHGQQLGPVSVGSFSTSPNALPVYQQTNPNYSLQLSLNQLESDLSSSPQSGQEFFPQQEKMPMTNGNHQGRQSRSRVINEHVPSHQTFGSKPLVRSESVANKGVSSDSTSLMNSRSTGAVVDYIQKERRAHTMAPMARILGPSSLPRANLFASVIAPSDAQIMKTQPRNQTIAEPSNNTYIQSNMHNNIPITNGHEHENDGGNSTAEDQDDFDEDQDRGHEVDNDNENDEAEGEDDDDDDDPPIVVKVRYDPESGAPPTEEEVRQAVEKQIRERAGKKPADNVVIVDFSKKQPIIRAPVAPPMSIRPQHQTFNRSGLLPTSSNPPFPLKPPGRSQNQSVPIPITLQQEQQRRQQFLLQQQKQKFLLQQQQQQQLLLQQQKQKQQLELFLQQQKQKALEQKMQQQRLQQQQEQQRLQQQQEQQRLQQQRIQEQREQQRLHEQRLRQQRLQEQQRFQQQQQFQIRQQQLQLQKQRQQFLQQQQLQKYKEKMYQQSLEQNQMEGQRNQPNSLLPPVPPRPIPTQPFQRPNPYQQTFSAHSTTNHIQVSSHTTFPIAPTPLTKSRQPIGSSNRKLTIAPSHSYAGLNSLSSYAPRYVPSLFIPINFELNNGRTSISVSHQNHTEIPNYQPPRPHTAPSSNEIYRPSSVTDIPELSQDNLRSMLENIPDLHGRNFKIEYAPENIDDGYPIPIDIDDRENRYTDALIVDKLPNSIMEHVQKSNNPTLVAALSPSSTTDDFSKSTIPIHLQGPYVRSIPSNIFTNQPMRHELVVQ